MPCRLVTKAHRNATCAAHGATTSAADRRSPCEVGGAAAGGIYEGAPAVVSMDWLRWDNFTV